MLRIFLSLDCTGKSIFVSEVQQLHIKEPVEMFVLLDAQGRTKRSLFEIREHFPKKVEIKDNDSLYRYYRTAYNPSTHTYGTFDLLQSPRIIGFMGHLVAKRTKTAVG